MVFDMGEIDVTCPICAGKVETRPVSPCMQCGAVPEGLDHLRDCKHTYAEMKLLGDASLVLCNVCMVDFGSNDPTFFGLPRSSPLGYERMQFVRDVEAVEGTDDFCVPCNHRTSFLRFVATLRQVFEKENSTGDAIVRLNETWPSVVASTILDATTELRRLGLEVSKPTFAGVGDIAIRWPEGPVASSSHHGSVFDTVYLVGMTAFGTWSRSLPRTEKASRVMVTHSQSSSQRQSQYS